MGGGANRGSTKSSNWNGYPKKRCANIGCKKRARYILQEDGKGYCIFCFNNYTIKELIESSVMNRKTK